MHSRSPCAASADGSSSDDCGIPIASNHKTQTTLSRKIRCNDPSPLNRRLHPSPSGSANGGGGNHTPRQAVPPPPPPAAVQSSASPCSPRHRRGTHYRDNYSHSGDGHHHGHNHHLHQPQHHQAHQASPRPLSSPRSPNGTAAASPVPPYLPELSPGAQEGGGTISSSTPSKAGKWHRRLMLRRAGTGGGGEHGSASPTAGERVRHHHGNNRNLNKLVLCLCCAFAASLYNLSVQYPMTATTTAPPPLTRDGGVVGGAVVEDVEAGTSEGIGGETDAAGEEQTGKVPPPGKRQKRRPQKRPDLRRQQPQPQPQQQQQLRDGGSGAAGTTPDAQPRLVVLLEDDGAGLREVVVDLASSSFSSFLAGGDDGGGGVGGTDTAGRPQSRLRPRREITLYPAEYTDVTQLYGHVDSHDQPALTSMERRVGPEDNELEPGGKCRPMAGWQATFHPTCNAFHELSIHHSLLKGDGAGGGDGDGGADADADGGGGGGGEDNHHPFIELVGVRGSWRQAWKLDDHDSDLRLPESADGGGPSPSLPVVLKTLKYERNFEEDYYETNRVDAVAMERLTSMPNVVDVYGFCGNSVLTEFANGEGFKPLVDAQKPLGKLRVAIDVASALAAVHGVGRWGQWQGRGRGSDDGEGTGAGAGTGGGGVEGDADGDGVEGLVQDSAAEADADAGRRWNDNVTYLVHNDINPSNVVVGLDGLVKLNDFNIGVMMAWNEEEGRHCRFLNKHANAQWRAPEEQMLDDQNSNVPLTEKIDIYALGNIIYRIVVGNDPWKEFKVDGRITGENRATVARLKRTEGTTPILSKKVASSTDPAIVALREIMEQCFSFEPEKRPTAYHVAEYLSEVLDDIMMQKGEEGNI